MVIARGWLCPDLGSGPVGSEMGAQCRFWRQEHSVSRVPFRSSSVSKPFQY